MARFSFNAKHNHQLITLVKWVRIFVKMFVICWWVSTYVAELFEFKFTLPNNPSKFTRCHRKSGRMCGCLPSMTIFITTSLSSQINIYTHDCWTLVRLVERDQWFFVVWEFWDFNRREGPHFARQDVLTRQSQNPTTLWYHFAAQQHWRLFLTLVQMYGHQIYKSLHQMLTLNLRIIQQHGGLGTDLACIHWLCLQHDKNCRWSEVYVRLLINGRNIRTRYFGSTSILLWRKDWSSIKLDRTLRFFTKHSQLIVFQKLLGWKF